MNRPSITDDDLAHGWNSLADRDISALVRSTRRRLWQMRIVLGVEIAITLAAYLGLVWMIQGGHSMPWIIYMTFFALAGTLMLAGSIALRRGTWCARGTQSHELLELALQRARVGAALARLHLWSLLLVWIFVAIWSAVTWSTTAVDNVHDPAIWLLAYGLAGGMSLASCAWTLRYLARKRSEAVHLQTELHGGSGSDGG